MPLPSYQKASDQEWVKANFSLNIHLWFRSEATHKVVLKERWGTCQWYLETVEYEERRRKPGSLLLIAGKGEPRIAS